MLEHQIVGLDTGLFAEFTTGTGVGQFTDVEEPTGQAPAVAFTESLPDEKHLIGAVGVDDDRG